MITYVRVIETTVYMLSIYDKTDVATLTDAEIKQLLESLNEEMAPE